MAPKPAPNRNTSTPPEFAAVQIGRAAGRSSPRRSESPCRQTICRRRGENTDGDESRGAHSLAPDGGDADHPIHDDDPSEDFTPRDYEEQIDEVADARADQEKRADVEEK